MSKPTIHQAPGQPKPGLPITASIFAVVAAYTGSSTLNGFTNGISQNSFWTNKLLDGRDVSIASVPDFLAAYFQSFQGSSPEALGRDFTGAGGGVARYVPLNQDYQNAIADALRQLHTVLQMPPPPVIAAPVRVDNFLNVGDNVINFVISQAIVPWSVDVSIFSQDSEGHNTDIGQVHMSDQFPGPQAFSIQVAAR